MMLQIPDAPWNLKSVYFITNLPIFNGANAIMVVVNRFTKKGEIFPQLKVYYGLRGGVYFLKKIFSCHGLLKEIFLDHEPRFVSLFFLLLTKVLDNKQCLLTALHPQSVVKPRKLIKLS